jgi:hypothetical protein
MPAVDSIDAFLFLKKMVEPFPRPHSEDERCLLARRNEVGRLAGAI